MSDPPASDELRVVPIMQLGHGFIDGPFVPHGADEHYLRNTQSAALAARVRPLTGDEIDRLVRNGNTADDWANLHVADRFNPRLIRNCEFYGLVRIGRLSNVHLEYHDMHVPAGITGSRIIACDIGDDCAVHNVQYLAHYIVGDNVILANIDEMHTTNHAKFGNGIVKAGEDESVRVQMSLINEAGGREVMPLVGMTAGDAYLWACHRDDADMVRRLGEITQNACDARRGYYGTVGDRCVIKHCRIIKDVAFGPHAYVKGANKLKNLTIASTREAPCQIGEGVELVNGIVSAGCHVFYGCKAVRFVMAPGSNLKYGARLIHSYLGDNSTISCCEVLNSLIFPCHEQHHNNSFLIAALLEGQSNMAASATIGSNHNSRAADGEMRAGRGFWPSLCVSTSHNGRFAPFTLLARGDYPSELNIPLPFSLVSNDAADHRLVILPGYWWLHNMYALVRNAAKFASRDRRVNAVQKIEHNFLAPDTAESIAEAMELMSLWTANDRLRRDSRDPAEVPGAERLELGHALLTGEADDAPSEVNAAGVERSRRPTVVIRARDGYNAYGEMLHHYAVTSLMAWLEANPQADVAAMAEALDARRVRRWVNLGGQIVAADDLADIRARIVSGHLDSWDDIHAEYEHLWQQYPVDRARHAWAILRMLLATDVPSAQQWGDALTREVEIQNLIADRVRASRRKDYDDPFRRIVYRNEKELHAVVGTLDDNSFVRAVATEAEAFARRADELRKRI